MHHKAFTLIELLVVVVILAILAAVAVPNFLQALTRAKVSRATADLRSAATGLEAYRIDHNDYPEPLERLSTPVAYVADAHPRDIFANPKGWFALGYLQAGKGSDLQFLLDFNVQNPTPEQRSELASHGYFVFSNGPDLLDEALEEPTESFRDVVRAPGARLGYFYDASNGTLSRGDITRTAKFQPAS